MRIVVGGTGTEASGTFVVAATLLVTTIALLIAAALIAATRLVTTVALLIAATRLIAAAGLVATLFIIVVAGFVTLLRALLITTAGLVAAFTLLITAAGLVATLVVIIIVTGTIVATLHGTTLLQGGTEAFGAETLLVVLMSVITATFLVVGMWLLNAGTRCASYWPIALIAILVRLIRFTVSSVLFC